MFAIASPSFLKVTNILDIFRAASIIGIMGIGLTIVQSTGDFDFAIGAEATVGACAIAKIMVELIPNFYIAFLLTMIVVACIGLFNSYIVINIGMQAFVATFGVSTLMVGICKISYRRRTILLYQLAFRVFYPGTGICIGNHPGFSYIVSFMHNHSLCIYGKD
ncbi:MAG: ABC transporter permease subunit [Enterocloster bolteae]